MNRVWKKVLATHEEPQTIAVGAWLGDNFPGVALPSTKAKGKWVIIRYENKFTCAQVVDIGPWCVDDDEYVFGTQRPRAERMKGQPCPMRKNEEVYATLPDGTECKKSNGAGIDLFPRVAKELGIAIGDNKVIEWSFIEP